MPLPNLTALAEAPPELLHAFAARLRALGVSPDATAPIVAASSEVAPPLRQPIRAFHLRANQTPLGGAMRMFVYNDPVSEPDARATLGDLCDPLLGIGLVTRLETGLWVSPFVLRLADHLLLLSDDLSHGSDAVMGFGETTIALCQAALPRQRVQRVLDLGCGSATIALILARQATQVTAADISPRALALARVNAAMNGISNMVVVESDLFRGLSGSVFDLIVCQPPFVPRAEGLPDATFLYGGSRGDELSLALLAQLPAHLAPGGRAVLFIEWPDDGDLRVEARIRQAVGANDANILVLQMPPTSLDSHAASYAAGLHRELGAAFEQEVLMRRQHFENVGIRSFTPTFVVIERSATPAFTDVLRVRPLAQIAPTSERIDKLLAARALSAAPEKLLAARLRVPEGTVLSQEQVGPGREVPSALAARFPPQVLVPPIDISLEMLGLLTAVHESETVEAALLRLAGELEVPAAQAAPRWLAVVARSLAYGVFEVG
jgi:methylase of polypeptide subunit release factors